MVICNNWGGKSTKTPVSRSSTEKKKSLDKILGNLCLQFGYYVIHRSNLTSSEMRHHMIGLSDQYHGYQGNHNSILVVFVANCNDKGKIVDDHGDSASANEFLQHFVHSRCPALIGKPKIFLMLLKVTTKNSTLPLLGDASRKKAQGFLSVDHDYPVHFEPEQVSLDEDYLLVRVMYEDANEDKPTFGGIASSCDDSLPWFAATFVKYLADQAGSKDVISIMKSIKREFHNQTLSARSATTTISNEKSSPATSYVLSMQRPPKDEGHVNIFIDQNLKRKLFLMPGL